VGGTERAREGGGGGSPMSSICNVSTHHTRTHTPPVFYYTRYTHYTHARTTHAQSDPDIQVPVCPRTYLYLFANGVRACDARVVREVRSVLPSTRAAHNTRSTHAHTKHTTHSFLSFLQTKKLCKRERDSKTHRRNIRRIERE